MRYLLYLFAFVVLVIAALEWVSRKDGPMTANADALLRALARGLDRRLEGLVNRLGPRPSRKPPGGE